MMSVTIWLLISISSGTYNVGTAATLAQVADATSCQAAANEFNKVAQRTAYAYCIPVKIR